MLKFIPQWVPKCKKCGNQMVDATALMMGIRFKCIKECSRIFQWQWNEEKRCIKNNVD